MGLASRHCIAYISLLYKLQGSFIKIITSCISQDLCQENIVCLKVEERLLFVIKYITLKKNTFYYKNIPSECIINRVSIYICLQENKYVHCVNEWRFNIYRECWTPIIAFQTKNTPENTFILFIFCVCILSFGEKKKNENTANAAVEIEKKIKNR